MLFRRLYSLAILALLVLFPAQTFAQIAPLVRALESSVGRAVVQAPQGRQFSRWTIEEMERLLGRSLGTENDVADVLRRLSPYELETVQSLKQVEYLRGNVERIEQRLAAAGLLSEARLSARARQMIPALVTEFFPARRKFFEAIGSTASSARRELLAAGAAVEEFSIGAGKALVVGKRLAAPGRQPIILTHGVMESSSVWDDVARALNDRGYDVWMPNWRGHGRTDFRSVVSSYARGDYGFASMMEEDLPAILEHVYATTGQRPLLVGHSMGGMLSRGAEEALILGRVEIGTPHDFTRLPWIFKIFSQMERSLPYVNGRSPVLDIPWTSPESLQSWLGTVFNVLKKSSLKWAADGLIRLENVTVQEFTELLDRTVSPLHEDIMRDFARFVRTGHGPADFNLSRMFRRGNRTPLLVIAGDADRLAPAREVLDEAWAVPKGSPVWTAMMEGTSHMDLVMGRRAADRIAPLIDQFIRARETLGAPGSHRIIR